MKASSWILIVPAILVIGSTARADFVTKWGSYGSGDGQFNGPRAVAMDGSGNVYVADQGNNRIQKFDGNGTFLTKWGSAVPAMGSSISAVASWWMGAATYSFAMASETSRSSMGTAPS